MNDDSDPHDRHPLRTDGVCRADGRNETSEPGQAQAQRLPRCEVVSPQPPHPPSPVPHVLRLLGAESARFQASCAWKVQAGYKHGCYGLTSSSHFLLISVFVNRPHGDAA